MEMKKKNKNCIKMWIKDIFKLDDNVSFNMVEVAVVIIIAILFGIIVGCILTYGRGFARATDNEYSNELLNTYEMIVNNYYNDIDEKDLVDAAIDGMVKSLGDEYSYYMNPSETTDFNQQINGSYIGIGATILFTEEGNYIVEIFKDSPAEKCGLKVNDIILSVDGVDVTGNGSNELSELLTGDLNTKVKIKVKRNEEEKEFSLVRGVVVIPSVHSKIVKSGNKNVGYIDIDTFAANTYSQFRNNLKKLEKENIDGLIIDVRFNSGGYISQVDKILSMFFDKKTVLYQIGTKNATKKVYSSTKESRKYDIVVLINSGSASASEILASCFQDNYKNATIVGNQSFGKGTAQSAIQLSTGSSLKYTSERWLTSKGVWLNGVGVTPDIVVDQEEGYYDSAGDNDAQFARALQLFNE